MARGSVSVKTSCQVATKKNRPMDTDFPIDASIDFEDGMITLW